VLIYHIVPHIAWQQALVEGAYRAPSLESEGFMHASTREQVADSANRHYHGQQGLALLVIDTEKVLSEVRFDPVTLHGEQTHFPHIYGPLNPDAVVDVLDLTPSPLGEFTFPGE
jgi:uncharacterized protein (DUF952 family)